MRKRSGILLLCTGLFIVCTVRSSAQDYTDTIVTVEAPVEDEGTSGQTSTGAGSSHQYKREYMDEYELEALRNKKEFQYRDLDSLADAQEDIYFKEEDKSSKRFDGFDANILLWLIVAVAAVVVVLQLVGVNMRQLFSPARLPQKQDSETLSENIHEIPFEKAIQNAIQSKDFSLATRLMYLQSLKLLSDRNMISWHENKTNWHYVYELKSEKLRSSFRDITYIFEYVQYGHMPLSETKFAIVQDTFRNFKTKLN